MFKAATALGSLGVLALGGYLTWSQISSHTITLEESQEYKNKSDNFGGKFSKFLVSTTKQENDIFWKQQITKLSDKDSVESDGYLKTSHDEAKAWKNNTKTLEQAVTALKTACKARYDDTTVAEPSDENNKKKWGEIWTYCSLEGVDKWNSTGKTIST